MTFLSAIVACANNVSGLRKSELPISYALLQNSRRWRESRLHVLVVEFIFIFIVLIISDSQG